MSYSWPHHAKLRASVTVQNWISKAKNTKDRHVLRRKKFDIVRSLPTSLVVARNERVRWKVRMTTGHSFERSSRPLPRGPIFSDGSTLTNWERRCEQMQKFTSAQCPFKVVQSPEACVLHQMTVLHFSRYSPKQSQTLGKRLWVHTQSFKWPKVRERESTRIRH